MKLSGIISSAALLFACLCAYGQTDGWTTLTNGVRIPSQWPPHIPGNYAPMELPYLDDIPESIDINLGRQLFVDEYLVESTDLERTAHTPKKASFNPIMKPETELEQGIHGIPCATTKDGGIWWDSDDNIFKMWYEAGWLYHMAYATSKDGIHWDRPAVNEKTGNNAVAEDILADSSTAWIDWFTDDPAQKYKMFLRPPNTYYGSTERVTTGWSMVSADGIHWDRRVPTGPCGDRSTVFYNPFIGKWVYSLRNNGRMDECPIGRCRFYVENEDFLEGASWKKEEMNFWCGADSLDLQDPYIRTSVELYNLSAVAYESVMIALPQIYLGPANKHCAKRGVPKITELKVAYSRDGFHWDRRDRGAFIRAERAEGFWDRGYVQSCGGLFNIVGDQLWFHYIGFAGNTEKANLYNEANGMHYGGSTGLAVLRRDGFVSMDAGRKEGFLTTRTVNFKGQYMFVNVDCPDGCLLVEVLDENGNVIEGFSREDCRALRTDSTIAQVKWKKSLSLLSGRNVKFRFILRSGSLYAFWVSPDKNGASHGYTAAGGPGLVRAFDTTGKDGYRQAGKYMLKNF